MHVDPALPDAMSDEEKAVLGGGHGRFIEALKESGELVLTPALMVPARAAVFRVRDGLRQVTDGPFLDVEQPMGGFRLVECADKERAIELAAQLPDVGIEGFGIEVREVLFSDGPSTTRPQEFPARQNSPGQRGRRRSGDLSRSRAKG
ncbi:YciI family protein [Embleya sp. NPDC055664]